jgi:sugar lactone lactonase YvrE
MNKKLFRLIFFALVMFVLIQSCRKDPQTNNVSPGPHIDSFAPGSAAKDSVVVITGANFSPDVTGNIVTFNGVAASVTTASATTLTVRVPRGAGNGKITVKADGKIAVSTDDFTYIYTISTLAGDGIAGFKEGEGDAAEFYLPFGIAVDVSGNIFVGDGGNNRIRKITAQGFVTTLAGNGTPGFADGAANVDAKFYNPEGVAVDASGNVFVADFANYRIRKISGGMVTTLAGNGIAGFNDGAVAAAQFFDPEGIAIDAGGNVFVAEYGNNRIRKITAGMVSTIAGSGIEGFKDGTAMNAQFDSPFGVAVDVPGNIYVGDFRNNRIRKITGSTVVTLAGDGTADFKDGAGPNAQFTRPEGVAVDASGNIYVADRGNHRIRKITTEGIVSTIAGNGTPGLKNGTGINAQFYFPSGIAVDASGNIYVTDYLNHCIRKLQ